MSKEIKAYQCDFCNKVSRTRSGIVNHESHCRYNPVLRFCHTCKNCDMQGIVYTETVEFTGETIESKGMFCNHYNEPIIRGAEAVYFKECEIDDNGYIQLNTPCSCFYYESKDGENE